MNYPALHAAPRFIQAITAKRSSYPKTADLKGPSMQGGFAVTCPVRKEAMINTALEYRLPRLLGEIAPNWKDGEVLQAQCQMNDA